MIHSKGRNKGEINCLARQGISVTYNRVQNVQLSVTKQLCKTYQENNLVCLPCLKPELFTTSAIDNIDHNPSSVTAKDSFHGTSISIFQHPDVELEKIFHNFKTDFVNDVASLELPEYYPSIPPTKNIQAEFPLQNGNHEKMPNFDSIEEMNQWTNKLEEINVDLKNRLSWAGFHSGKHNDTIIPTISSLLPLLKESVYSTAMVRHTMGIVGKIAQHLNPGQVPIMTADQPVYALGKQIQWVYPNKYGE